MEVFFFGLKGKLSGLKVAVLVLLIARVKTERILLRYRTDWLLPFRRPNPASSMASGWCGR